MKRLTVALLAGVLAIGGAATASATQVEAGVRTSLDSQWVPEAIKAPASNKRIATYRGDGVQIYGCLNGAWTFIQPAATLSDYYGTSVAIHFAGPAYPRWESTKDGSLVGAQKIASADKPGAVPQLLLKATENNGGRGTQFGEVTYVQRLNTRGGLAPAGKCNEGARASVSYTADYVFWGAQ
ncbi:DUF3455 domain-containing protein [Saccharopolyspora phatthalungensis]|uniref:DUF3455 domain-containing protein n=1 Tax=Saccharopolyspora phatthalungensis TaxID=664693 RepID=A0A840QKT7_9PSEU|nr:DUF3455 domain-containing protein [Saccharopolyspora phatthalungensis]MBB5159383.1 hypothetical protein [Saccharopolyspora phatthalungensis]